MAKYFAPFINFNYNKVYLCVKPLDKMEYYSLNCRCIPFDTYKEADDYYVNHFLKNNIEIQMSTLVPVCKYIPTAYQPVILNYKLSKLFINAQVETPNTKSQPSHA
jgi:hypothetical protein